MQFGFWSDSCYHCGFNYFENNKEVCTWNTLTAFCHKILPFIPSALLVHWFVYVEESSREDILTLYCPIATCSVLQACSCRDCTGIMWCFWTCQVKLQRECEAVTSHGMFDQPLFCKVAVCVLLVLAAQSGKPVFLKGTMRTVWVFFRN